MLITFLSMTFSPKTFTAYVNTLLAAVRYRFTNFNILLPIMVYFANRRI